MTVNRYRGEVAIPELGDGVFLCFDLDDFATVESIYGLKFFDRIEEIAHSGVPAAISSVMKIVLRKRDASGGVTRIGAEYDFGAALQKGFTFSNASKPILDALSESLMGKRYDDLLKEAAEARKAQMKSAIAQAKEAAAESDVPFEALLNALLMPQTA